MTKMKNSRTPIPDDDARRSSCPPFYVSAPGRGEVSPMTALEYLDSLNPKAATRFPFDNRYAARLRQGAVRRGAHPSCSVSLEKLMGRWEYYEGRCAYCGKIADTFDHVKPIFLGGAHIASNLRPACKRCNSSKMHHMVARA